MATQYDIVRLATVVSTQDAAREMMAASGRSTLVVADRQVTGRGRQGRAWVPPDRGMFASLSFVSDWDVPVRTLIPLATAVAVADSVDEMFDLRLGLRWPNDLMMSGDKVGGILVETSGDIVTVGCGLNLWWADPIEGARGLLGRDPGDSIAPALAAAWVEALVGYLEKGSEAWPREAYEEASLTLGREVTWEDGTGSAVAIADDGALVVAQGDELVVLRAGEVHTQDRR